MEDASAVDLDWFWRGWFYGIEPCDISIDEVAWYKIDTKNPEVEKKFKKEIQNDVPESISKQRDKTAIPVTRVMTYPEIKDFYNTYDPFKATDYEKSNYQQYLGTLSEEEKKLLNADKNIYWITFENVGGLIMPLILEFEYIDGTKEVKRIPAEIWRLNNSKVSKTFITDKPIKQISLDPYQETADIDLENNFYPQKEVPSKLQLFKEKQREKEKNLMQLQKEGKL